MKVLGPLHEAQAFSSSCLSMKYSLTQVSAVASKIQSDSEAEVQKCYQYVKRFLEVVLVLTEMSAYKLRLQNHLLQTEQN